MKKNNNLDEMQEQKLLHIEHNGCWLAFWGLVVAVIVEGLMGFSFREVLGEVLLTMVLSLYILIDCLRNGIWDRRLKPTFKTNLLGALVAAVIASVYIVATNHYLREPLDYVLTIAIGGGTTFVLTFGLLTLCGKIYSKRKEKLESE